MEYGNLLSRSVNLVWENKYLIIVGILASLGSGSFGSGSFSGGGGGGNGSGQQIDDELAGLVVGAVLAIVCVALVIGILVWIVSTIARGGLIASVDAIESGEKSSFRQSWSAGWQRAWTLLGISIVPAIPALILFVVGLMAFGAYGGLFALFGDSLDPLVGVAGLGSIFAVVACIFIPIMLVLSILRNFAERACMLEGLGAVDSYRRGTNVLTSNLGEAVVLFLIQVAIFIVLGILLFIPGLFAAIFICCLWPLVLAVQGALEAFVSALWTLAWRSWTGEPPMAEKAPTTV